MATRDHRPLIIGVIALTSFALGIAGTLVTSCSAPAPTIAKCAGELVGSLCWRDEVADDLDWNTAQQFCRKLKARLPTKAEMEALTKLRALPKVLGVQIARVGKCAGFWTSTEHGDQVCSGSLRV